MIITKSVFTAEPQINILIRIFSPCFCLADFQSPVLHPLWYWSVSQGHKASKFIGMFVLVYILTGEFSNIDYYMSKLGCIRCS